LTTRDKPEPESPLWTTDHRSPVEKPCAKRCDGSYHCYLALSSLDGNGQNKSKNNTKGVQELFHTMNDHALNIKTVH